MTRAFNLRRATIAMLLGPAFVLSASAADQSPAFPQKPIKILVPFPAGSGTDASARIIGAEISKASGQPVIVENKPGANGFIATEQVAKAVPDGHTMLVTSNTHVANKFLFKRLPYDPLGDFKSVALYRKSTPLVLVVPNASRFKTLNDVTNAAKKEPGKLTFASGNSSSRVAGELYKQLTGTDLLYVPYKGNPEALSEVAAGRVDMMFSDATACLPLLAAGKLRAIVATGSEPLPLLPGVPTSTEAGLPKLELGSWGMLLVPRNTPDAIAERLNALVNAAIGTPKAERYFRESNGGGFIGSRADLDRFIASESDKWGGIIKKAGIEPE